MTTGPGILYIVATPIGNLQDISLRAVEILQAVNLIAAEDTRHSLALLKNFSITTPVLSLHEHNERERTAEFLGRLERGESIALISDAGTPLLSDPGYHLVHEAKKTGLTVSSVPGACAAIAALSISGLPTDRFTFEGFLPVKPSARKQRVEILSKEPRTMVFYESPHRILNFLQALQQSFGENRRAMFARELTKIFETTFSGTLSELVRWASHDKNQQRGEIVVIVAGAPTLPPTDDKDILAILLQSLSLKQAVEIAAKITGLKKNALYQRALQMTQ